MVGQLSRTAFTNALLSPCHPMISRHMYAVNRVVVVVVVVVYNRVPMPPGKYWNFL